MKTDSLSEIDFGAIGCEHLESAIRELIAAAQVVVKEAEGRADFRQKDWNPEAHIELTLTIAEIRRLEDAYKLLVTGDTP